MMAGQAAQKAAEEAQEEAMPVLPELRAQAVQLTAEADVHA